LILPIVYKYAFISPISKTLKNKKLSSFLQLSLHLFAPICNNSNNDKKNRKNIFTFLEFSFSLPIFSLFKKWLFWNFQVYTKEEIVLLILQC
jgi:hypothetical protein